MNYCIETHRRIKLLLSTYFYEVLNTSVIDDATWDELARSINLHADTNKPKLDKWFRKHFKPYTGQWIYKFPKKELKKLSALAAQLTEEGCFLKKPL